MICTLLPVATTVCIKNEHCLSFASILMNYNVDTSFYVIVLAHECSVHAIQVVQSLLHGQTS